MFHLTKEQADALNQATQSAGDDMRACFDVIAEAWNRAFEKAVVSVVDTTKENQ